MLRVFGKLGQGMKVGESVAVTLESSAESPDALRVSLNDHEWPREKEHPDVLQLSRQQRRQHGVGAR